MSSSQTILFVSPLLFFSCSIAQDAVALSKPFKLVNSVLFYKYVEGDDAYYTDAEEVENQCFQKLFTHPFSLCFYALDPNQDKNHTALTLAVRLQECLVWIAKKSKPVGINATLTSSYQGNLVLADANGQMVWQTCTVKKGVYIRLLPDENMFLLDNKGRFVWSSFHYPIDLLLVGQSIRANGVNKLVSQRTPVDTPGPYSLVMENKTITFYY